MEAKEFDIDLFRGLERYMTKEKFRDNLKYTRLDDTHGKYELILNDGRKFMVGIESDDLENDYKEFVWSIECLKKSILDSNIMGGILR